MVLVLFGITILVHELGHFLAARRLGLVAETFSIGFGPALWKRKFRGVVYKLGWFPAGGYVSLPQMEPSGGRRSGVHGDPTQLPRVAPWRKIVVALAGAAGNLILALALAYVIYWVGKPSTPQESSNVVGYVATNAAAYAAGLRPGDRIIAANDETVSSWQDLNVVGALNEELTLRVVSGASTNSMVLPTESGGLGVKGIRGLPGVEGVTYCKVEHPVPGSSADTAGVQPGDLIESFDGITLYSIAQLVELVNARRDRAVAMVVDRDGERHTLQVTPRHDEKLGRAVIGVRFNTFYLDKESLVHPKPLDQIRSHASLILRTLRALLTPREAKHAAGSIGGPPMIFTYLWTMLQTSFVMGLWFTCLLNVNLAIINLLPLPVLDGGHICFALWEMISRKPVNERLASVLTTIFAVLLIAAMLFLSVRDVDRMFGPAQWFRDEPQPVEADE
jgi:regulator of sigma E protease